MTTVEAADSSRLEGLPESLELYRRGLTDAPLVSVTADGTGGPGSTRAAGEASLPDDEMTFVISTDEVDRHGDIIVADGWRLDAYRRNPVVLWAHDYRRPVVGRTLALWPEAAADEPGVHRLLARIRFAPHSLRPARRHRCTAAATSGASPSGSSRWPLRSGGDLKTGAFSGDSFPGAGVAGGQPGAGPGQPQPRSGGQTRRPDSGHLRRKAVAWAGNWPVC